MAKKKKRGGGYALAMLALVITMVGFAGMAHAESCTARYFKDYPGRFCLNDEQHYINGAYLGNFLSFEGATDDAYQTIFLITEPTADRVITIPDGNVTLSTGTALTTSLADGKILIGNSGGVAVAVTPSTDWTITNTGVATIGTGVVNTGKITNSTITLTDMAYQLVTVNIPASVAFKNTTITDGYIPISVYPFANVISADLGFINQMSASGTTLTVIANGTSALERVYKVFLVAP